MQGSWFFKFFTGQGSNSVAEEMIELRPIGNATHNSGDLDNQKLVQVHQDERQHLLSTGMPNCSVAFPKTFPTPTTNSNHCASAVVTSSVRDPPPCHDGGSNETLIAIGDEVKHVDAAVNNSALSVELMIDFNDVNSQNTNSEMEGLRNTSDRIQSNVKNDLMADIVVKYELDLDKVTICNQNSDVSEETTVSLLQCAGYPDNSTESAFCVPTEAALKVEYTNNVRGSKVSTSLLKSGLEDKQDENRSKNGDKSHETML